jgi:branched-chain amino acid transport system ATP-binding protein
MLTVEGLTQRFGGFTAVSSVSFAVTQGEILGLIGPNGSGKSTIFNVLAGTLAPNAGSIRFEGREIGGLPPHRIINLGIGRTFQIPRPFRRLSLVDNVVLAGFFGQGGPRGARPSTPPSARSAWSGCRPIARPLVDGLGAAALKKLELAKALATGPSSCSPTRA